MSFYSKDDDISSYESDEEDNDGGEVLFMLACFQTEAEYACLSLMEKFMISSAVIMAWQWQVQQ
jgi:hypothetical protein